MSDYENMSLELRPSAQQRFWQWLGFGGCGTPSMDDLGGEDGLGEGALVTKVVTVFDWPDRMRVLLSGTIVCVTATKTDQPVGRAISRSKVGVLSPRSERVLGVRAMAGGQPGL